MSGSEQKEFSAAIRDSDVDGGAITPRGGRTSKPLIEMEKNKLSKSNCKQFKKINGTEY